MPEPTAGNKTNSKGDRAEKAYAPSWVDRFTARVTRLPGPSWLYYPGLALVLFLLQTLVLWGEGALPVSGIVHSVHGFLSGTIAVLPALIQFLDNRASRALFTLRPALKVSEQEFAELRYRLTTLPGRPALLASLGALAIVSLVETVGQHYQLEMLVTFPLSANLLRLVYYLCWWVFGAFMYHTVHQLRLINRIYTQHMRIDLFGVSPLYLLSNIPALTAGALIVIPCGFLLASQALTLDVLREDPASLVLILIIQSVAVAAFLWPQLGIHRLQVTEKERLLGEANKRFEAIIVELHRLIDGGELEGIGDLNTAMSTLEMERNALRRIPAWPWEPEVVRLLITALALPLGLWITQFVLQRLLAS